MTALLLGERATHRGVPVARLGLELYLVDGAPVLGAASFADELARLSSLPAVEAPPCPADVAAVGRVAAALLGGRTVATGGWEAGPVAHGWTCRGAAGAVWSVEEWSEGDRHVEARDLSAFAAARAFVGRVGVEAALAALRPAAVAPPWRAARALHGDHVHAVAARPLVQGRWRRAAGEALCRPRGLRLVGAEGAAVTCPACLGEAAERSLAPSGGAL